MQDKKVLAIILSKLHISYSMIMRAFLLFSMRSSFITNFVIVQNIFKRVSIMFKCFHKLLTLFFHCQDCKYLLDFLSGSFTYTFDIKLLFSLFKHPILTTKGLNQNLSSKAVNFLINAPFYQI